jgi:arylsulfatase A-like enzyme
MDQSPNPVFDHHLSFVWVALILLFLVYSFKITGTREFFSPLVFSIEIVTFVILFQFCSNPHPYFKVLSHWESYCNASPALFIISSYILGVLLILGIYFFVFSRIRPFLNTLFLKHSYIMLSIIVVSVCAFLFFSYVVSYNNNSYKVVKESSHTISQPREKKASNVILIVLDALRADRLSLYNKNSNTAKNLELLAQDSLVFEKCIAPSPWTLPSHASLFTGLYVSEHKCEYIISQFPILSKNCKTLAEIFQDNGFRTAAVVSNSGWLDRRFNVHQGFEVYNCMRTIGIQQSMRFRPLLVAFSYLTNIYSKSVMSMRSADLINREAINIVDTFREEPFFLFLNYMETHTPYLPPRPFDNYFLHKTFTQLYRLKQYYLRVTGAEDKQSWDLFLQSQYDGAITYLDSQLGRLFSRLKETGVYDSSLIIVTADHGDLLGEHGAYEHHEHMYEGVVKVPLIIKYPFSKRVGRETRLINLVDLFPTILSICELPVPANISGQAFGGPASAVAELYSFDLGIHKIIYDGKYKYLEYRPPDKEDYYRPLVKQKSTKAVLYDLENDPQENDNLVEKFPDIASTMKIKLQTWERARKPITATPVKPEPLSKEVKDNLKALGYVQ